MEALNSQKLTVRVTDLRKGDVLLATNGVITHAPYDSFRCPKGKINVGKVYNRNNQPRTMKATLIYFSSCPDFATINELKHQYYIVIAGCQPGCYAIVLELAANGKVNKGF